MKQNNKHSGSGICYLDHSATTYVRPEVKQVMLPFLDFAYGNPGSFHSKGLEARNAMQSARSRIAKALNCSSDELVFTGSGTESANLAIKGTAQALKHRGRHIITSAIEHHAVLHTCKWLEKNGFEVTYLKPDKYGRIKPESVENLIRKDTVLVSIMFANNEIGTLNPIRDIALVCRKHKVIFHTDACQAGTTQKIDLKDLSADLFTLNGSKLYGPKGIGLLFIKHGTPAAPIIHGGHQENGMRAGTENVASIVGFAKAIELAQKECKDEAKRLKGLRDSLERQLLAKIPESFVNGHPKQRLSNILNITILNVEGEAMLLMLDRHGICASTGSACTSQSLDPSHVLLGIGLPYEAAHGSLRFSFGRCNTKKDVDKVVKTLPGIVKELRKMSPVNLKIKDVLK